MTAPCSTEFRPTPAAVRLLLAHYGAYLPLIYCILSDEGDVAGPEATAEAAVAAARMASGPYFGDYAEGGAIYLGLRGEDVCALYALGEMVDKGLDPDAAARIAAAWIDRADSLVEQHGNPQAKSHGQRCDEDGEQHRVQRRSPEQRVVDQGGVVVQPREGACAESVGALEADHQCARHGQQDEETQKQEHRRQECVGGK